MTDWPPATVIVASYDRPGKIRDCVRWLQGLDYPDLRIIVVDDGSPAPISDLVEPAPRLRILRQDNAGPAAARNTGVTAAETDLILFTDDDVRPRPGWIQHLARAYLKDRTALLGGYVSNGLPDDIYAAASQGLCDYLYAYYGAGAGHAPFFTTNNMAFSRACYLRIGGLDASFRFASEDRDLGMRWKAQGWSLIHVPEAVADHYHDMSLPAFWRQHASYGAGARKLHLTMDKRGDPRPKVEPWTFYSGILTHPFRARARLAPVQAFLMGLSQVAMVWGYARSRRAERRDQAG